MNTKSTGYQILHFPLTKIIIGIIVLMGIVLLGQFGTEKLLSYTTLEKNISKLIVGTLSAVLALVSYTLLYTYYEKRTITELSTKGIGRNLTIGILLGALLQSLSIGVIYLNGGYTIVSVNPVLYLLPSLTMAFTSAIFEEILVRAIIFRILEEKLGSFIALIISAAIFGALHLANPHSSMTAAIGLALQAGLFLAAAYIFTRNLWFPIAIHFAWNFTQAGIFGAAVSGNVVRKSLFTSTITGDEWYTGGAFGPEGSVQATVFCLIATVILLWMSKNKFIQPFWKNKSGTNEPQHS